MTSRPILSWIVDAFNGPVKESIHLKQIRIVVSSKFFRPLNVSFMVHLFVNLGEDPRAVPRQIVFWISVVLFCMTTLVRQFIRRIHSGRFLISFSPFVLGLVSYPLVLAHSLLRRNDRCFELPRELSLQTLLAPEIGLKVSSHFSLTLSK